MQRGKLLAQTTYVAHFRGRGKIGQQETHADVSKFKVPKNNFPPTIPVYGHQKAHGGTLKFKAPKEKISFGTSVAQFQEYYKIGQLKTHVDVSKSKTKTSTYETQLQEHNEIGEEEPLNIPKISKERQKSKNYPKRFDSPRSPSNGLPKYSQIAKTTNKYRALPHKYLTLEEESSNLEEEWKKTENEVKGLEKEKYALLDKLIVLEGLVDPT
jgi:hypothetical protein